MGIEEVWKEEGGLGRGRGLVSGDIRPHNLQVQTDGEIVAFVLFLSGRVPPLRVDLRSLKPTCMCTWIQEHCIETMGAALMVHEQTLDVNCKK